jgi:hypothetical protein
MTMHRACFLVEVTVENWEADDRDPVQYAAAALRAACLPDARSLDGYADLDAEAGITSAEVL